MNKITIDCSSFSCREDLHRTFAEALCFPAHYGHNLDALHDCLTDITAETGLHLSGWDEAEAALGAYAISAKKAIVHASSANPLLAVTFI